MIKIGDIYSLTIHAANPGGSCTHIPRAQVIQTPRGPGDHWGFRDLAGPSEWYTTAPFTCWRAIEPPMPPPMKVATLPPPDLDVKR